MSKLARGLMNWLDERLPVTQKWKQHVSEYYAPKNFNFWYYFGSLALVVLVIQILSGIWLAMNYTPTDTEAFSSIEYIMRDVQYGDILRYMHTTGASAFFIVVYLHMVRGLMYGSYQKPRELIWILGMAIFMALMVEAFFGYLLPWGQMSFWGAQVITSLFGAVPYVGESLMVLVRGDFNISGVTLNRFFALHVVALPLVLVALVFIHLMALHEVGSNNPDGIEIKKHKDAQGKPLDGIPFHPYYSVKDLVGVGVFLIAFCAVMFFVPEMGGYFIEHPNYVPADHLTTPEHIAPVWYMTPFYSILRAIPDKLSGVTAMGAALAILFVLPWLDRSPVKSIRYRGNLYKAFFFMFIICFIGLGYLGGQAPTPIKTLFARVFTLGYFAFFLLMPLYTKYDRTKPVPQRIPD
jgi:ubiquinol-cytochrome c reductase cytochrome b subunit